MRPAVRFRYKYWIHLLLLSLINTQSIVSIPNINVYINNTLPNVCPYSTFCTQGPALQFPDEAKKTCCVPCSCRADCYLRGNCCPDFNPKTTPTTTEVKCKPPAHFVDPRILQDIPPINYYYIVDSCPGGYEDKATKEKCVNPRPRQLKDIIDVATISNGELIYANRHCAKCNNLETFSTWTPVLYNTYFNETSAEEGSLTANDVLYFVPPTEAEQTRRSQCYPSSWIVDRCNVTGKQNFYDYNLITACQQSAYLYTENHHGRENIYKNPHCFLCNYEKGTELEHLCNENDPIDIRGTTVTRSFAVLLNMRETDHVVNVDDPARTCRKDEIYDKFFAVCRRLYCPIFSVPVNGACTPMHSGVHGFIVTIVFGLTTAEDIQLAELDDGTTNKINRKVKKSIGLTDKSCTECMNMMFDLKQGNRTGLFLSVNYQTALDCPLQTLLDTFRKLSQIHVTATIQKKPTTFIGQQSYEFNKHDFSTTISDMDYKYLNTKATHCPMKYLLQDRFCPYIEVSKREFNNMTHHLSPLNVISKFRFVDKQTDPVYRICTEDYKVKQSINRANSLSISTIVFVGPIACLFSNAWGIVHVG